MENYNCQCVQMKSGALCESIAGKLANNSLEKFQNLHAFWVMLGNYHKKDVNKRMKDIRNKKPRKSDSLTLNFYLP